GLDYTPTSGTLVFHDGETVQSCRVPIHSDMLPEPDETIEVVLSNPGGAALPDPNSAVLVILDDDQPVITPPQPGPAPQPGPPAPAVARTRAAAAGCRPPPQPRQDEEVGVPGAVPRRAAATPGHLPVPEARLPGHRGRPLRPQRRRHPRQPPVQRPQREEESQPPAGCVGGGFPARPLVLPAAGVLDGGVTRESGSCERCPQRHHPGGEHQRRRPTLCCPRLGSERRTRPHRPAGSRMEELFVLARA